MVQAEHGIKKGDTKLLSFFFSLDFLSSLFLFLSFLSLFSLPFFFFTSFHSKSYLPLISTLQENKLKENNKEVVA